MRAGSFSIGSLLVRTALALNAPPVHAGPMLFVPLGDVAGGRFESSANTVSGDGSVVAGTASSPASGVDYEAFRWTAQGGMQGMGGPPPGGFGHIGSYFRSASGDG